ncbi:MAG TPA: substrate-binding domain-containing protein [Acidimicrobiales bacterium]|jgi:phosphate transport system substrate-binding protein|nr:substrate-binding domain-containing protein [Acidimicrobiales bacterium]
MLALPLCLSMVAAACGGDDDDSASTGGEGGGSEEAVSGSVNISGSSTVEPISSLVAEDFQAENEDVDIAVDGPGTGDGFELFCNGETDISDASRTIKDEEAAACEENGVEYVELQIGYDGLTVMTNPNNDDVECLSFADLYALTGPESEGFGKWSDAQALATELGSSTELPDATLDLTGPGAESGTYDSFIEIALAGIAGERGQADDTTRTDYAASADDNVIIQNIEASDTSLGWVGFAFAQEAGDQIKELEVSAEPDGECVAPTAETIADQSYPLSRSLYIYVNKAKAEENPAVAAYVDFYLGDLTSFVEDSDYVALPDDVASETTSAWDAR